MSSDSNRSDFSLNFKELSKQKFLAANLAAINREQQMEIDRADMALGKRFDASAKKLPSKRKKK